MLILKLYIDYNSVFRFILKFTAIIISSILFLQDNNVFVMQFPLVRFLCRNNICVDAFNQNCNSDIIYDIPFANICDKALLVELQDICTCDFRLFSPI